MLLWGHCCSHSSLQPWLLPATWRSTHVPNTNDPAPQPPGVFQCCDVPPAELCHPPTRTRNLPAECNCCQHAAGALRRALSAPCQVVACGKGLFWKVFTSKHVAMEGKCGQFDVLCNNNHGEPLACNGPLAEKGECLGKPGAFMGRHNLFIKFFRGP